MTPVCSDEKVSKRLRESADRDDLKDVILTRVLEPKPKAFSQSNEQRKILTEDNHLIMVAFSYLVCNEAVVPASFNCLPQVCKKWREVYDNSLQLWKDIQDTLPTGSINWNKLRNRGTRNEGTEGLLMEVAARPNGSRYAVKRARVYPQGEGVPYYMIRELAVLKGMSHSNVASLLRVNLQSHRLHVFFDFIPHTLHDYLNPANDTKKGRRLPEAAVKNLLRQLLKAVAYCHRRGVLHRNLKPKHLLIEGADPPPSSHEGDEEELLNLDTAKLKMADFALVRLTGYPRRAYTNEVVTLWYRPPEILMGVRDYLPAVDMWSVGCIFAEMVLGRPIFTGVSEVDQLFQIFSKLSTPTRDSWPEFETLPNYNFTFPNWVQDNVGRLFPGLSGLGVDLLSRLLVYDPSKRITANQALLHPFFDENEQFGHGSCTSCHSTSNKNYRACNEVFSAFSATLSKGVVDNMNEYLSHLREQESLMWPVNNIFHKQTTIRPNHRSMLVDWLVEVVDVFDMSQRTAFLAISYTDRYMKDSIIERAKYQLIGATCLHIASKCEDVSYIGIDDLAMCADSVFKPQDVLQMEEEVLNVLDFTLSVPTVLDFVTLFIEISRFHLTIPGNRFAFFCKYMAEISLLNHEFSMTRPSLVATSIIVYSLHVFQSEPWPQELEELSNVELQEIKDVIEEVYRWHSVMFTHQLQVVRKRYLKEDVYEVGNIPAPSSLLINWV